MSWGEPHVRDYPYLHERERNEAVYSYVVHGLGIIYHAARYCQTQSTMIILNVWGILSSIILVTLYKILKKGGGKGRPFLPSTIDSYPTNRNILLHITIIIFNRVTSVTIGLQNNTRKPFISITKASRNGFPLL